MPKPWIVLMTVDQPVSGQFTACVEKASGETTF
jgi:hypothetical protein